MRCIRCEKDCQTDCGRRDFANCCSACGSCDLYIKCDSGGGCVEALFWGFLAIATFGLALIIPLALYKGTGRRECVAVCRRCGHIQRIGYANNY